MKVTKEITKLENSAVKLTVTIAKKDVAQNYNDTVAKYAKNIQMPGFRKGHVPVSILERKYGEALKADAAGELIEKALGDIFEEIAERPLPYAQPAMDEAPVLDTSKDMTFTVTYDVFPTVKVEDFSGITVKEPQVAVGEAELKEELEQIRERNALVSDKKDGEAAAKDDIATVNYCELDDDGKTVEGSERQDFVFTIGSGQNIYKIDDDVIGMKKGETKEITKKYKKDFEDKDLAGTTKKLRVTVTALKVRNLPELDDELAQDVNEKYKTLDDLKADIMKNMEAAKAKRIAEIKSNSLLEQLVEKNAFDLPKSMIAAELDSRWRMMAQQFRTTPEQLDKMIAASGQKKEDMLTEWTGDAEKMLKSRIVVESLMKERNITVTPEEIEAEYVKIAESAGISVEEVKKHYADPRAKEYLIDDTKEQKLYKELFEQVKITKGDKMSFADLFKK
ncbi:trigger factor [Treponema brennaborense]|uniref:Trigger factor n=1 Tax=Treponema brennaborense (strain DSM 12168 / CIP 105900 / DD5/3) TaxID=906968 RepID=F4LPD7_TREBD|nr:trigger factor [Treponema brennaborense]AEE16999.1 Trigger factor [Treponema brennaborense DSM 12168]